MEKRHTLLELGLPLTMRILNYFLPYGKFSKKQRIFSFFAAGLFITPFGAVDELLNQSNPWRGSDFHVPLLVLMRIQKIEGEKVTHCTKWLEALKRFPAAERLAGVSSRTLLQEKSWKGWEPWSEKDQLAITGCKAFPCDVKLNVIETNVLVQTEEAKRFKKFLHLVQIRLGHYEKTKERKEYEFPGDPIDPWSHFEKIGLVAKSQRPPTPSYLLRRLDFASPDLLPVRQMLDRRFIFSRGKKYKKSGDSSLKGVVWIRDVYTDHYFDSWGEWLHLRCSAHPKQVTVSHVLLLEIDELKKTGIISKLVQGRVLFAVRENGFKYLDRVMSELLSMVE